jgi:hypothetical protein
MAVFAVEDASVPHVPLVHAAWHCLSALSTSLVNCVLADAEARYPELTLDALAAPLQAGDSSAGAAASAPHGRGHHRQHHHQHQQQQQRGEAPAGP